MNELFVKLSFVFNIIVLSKNNYLTSEKKWQPTNDIENQLLNQP